MSHDHLVSIITPLYKSGAYLKNTYTSVSQSTHTHWEWILVDDASPDNTLAVAQSLAAIDSRIRVFKHETNHGAPAAGRNTGISEAKGDYITFLDHDDSFESYKLAHQIAEIERQNIAFICGNANLLNQQTEVIDGTAWGDVIGTDDEIRSSFSRRLLSSNFVPPNTTLIRKEAVAAVGLFDTNFSGVDDYDYWYRISRLFPCGITRRIVATWRYKNSASISYDDTRMVQDELHFYTKIFNEASDTPSDSWEREVARDGILRTSRMLANRMLIHAKYLEASTLYANAGKPLLSTASRLAGPALRLAYEKYRSLRASATHPPLMLDFTA